MELAVVVVVVSLTGSSVEDTGSVFNVSEVLLWLVSNGNNVIAKIIILLTFRIHRRLFSISFLHDKRLVFPQS